MTVFSFGSVNVDHVYSVPHLPAPGETLAAQALSTMLGGKGANQSVAAALAGAEVRHIGAVGADGRWAVAELASYGVDVTHVAEVDHPTGHAIISVDAAGENAILLFAGANWVQSEAAIARALRAAGPGDSLLLQNETSHQAEAAKIARGRGCAWSIPLRPSRSRRCGRCCRICRCWRSTPWRPRSCAPRWAR